MKKTITILLFVAIFTVSCGCHKLFSDNELTMKRKPYLGTELRTDGYYYNKELNFYRILFLYRNGVVLALPFSPSEEALSDLEESFRNGEFYQKYKNNKRFWGVFAVANNSIVYEQWGINQGGGKPVWQFSGPILSDTSFLINKYLEPKTGESHEKNQIWYFKQFFPKPDSTNSFIP